MKRIFISDCEGPISKNDNAFELAARFIPDGEKLFANISKYDDVLADVLQKKGYTAGSTLKLILPFFKAYGVSDKQMEDYSAEHIVLIADSQKTMRHIQAITDSFIVSTSYEHYIKPLCDALVFTYKNTYCTKLCLDKYPITKEEKTLLKKIAGEIAKMPLIEIPPQAKFTKDFSQKDQESLKRLDEIFWTQIPSMSVGKVFVEVTTVGGEQKAESIKDAVKRLKVRLEDVMYVGDSITDVQAFKLVNENGGLTVSFNGNGYAVKNAQIAVQSEGNFVTAVIAELFYRSGKVKTLEAVKSWSPEELEQFGVDKVLLKELPGSAKIQIVTPQNMETLVKESSDFRKKVRGVAIGRLG